MKNLVVIFISALVLNGCAVMNSSLTETAEPLKPFHTRFGLELANGIDFSAEESIVHPGIDSTFREKLFTSTLIGFKAGIGIFPHFELNFKGWSSAGNTGSRIYGKLGFYLNNDSTFAIAVMPGFNSLESEYDPSYFNSKNENYTIKSTGLEVVFVTSYQVHSKITFYGALRYAKDELKLETERHYGFSISRIGFTGGVSMKAYPFYLRPELGIEFVNHDGLSSNATAIYGLGIGLEF